MRREDLTRMERLITTGEMRMDEPMKRHTTLGIGGPAEIFVRPGDREELLRLLRYAAAQKIPIQLLGSGSNCLVSDAGVSGLVISLAGTLNHLTIEDDRVVVEAGVMLGHMVKRCRAAGLAGLESLGGVPGTVGGALVMNAGAFGAEISNHLTAVNVVNHQGRERRYAREDLSFGYRSSSFEPGEIIIGGEFKFPWGQEEQVAKASRLASRERKTRQPLTKRSAGSVFKNPRPDLAAGWLLDEAGLKGTRIGDAQISPQHANFFINRGSATGEDMARLIKLAAGTIKARFKVQLELEIRTLGFPRGFWEEAGLGR